jgi:hypothetical protein
VSEDPATEPVERVQPATGHPVVDDVLASLDGLEERPVDEHVAVFETLHDRLREALASAGDPSRDPTGDHAV